MHKQHSALAHLTITSNKLNMDKSKNNCKESLMMQVRHLIAIYCYDFMFTPEDAGTVSQQSIAIQKHYLGEDIADETNFVDMFFLGDGPFTGCLECHPDQSGAMILNRDIFGVTETIVVDQDEEKSDLKKSHITTIRNRTTTLSGGTIRTYALDAIKITKKAKSFTSGYMNNGKLPSGKNENDLIRHVEEKMFQLDHGNGSKDKKTYNPSTGYKFSKTYAIFRHSILPPLLRPESFHELKCLAESDSNVGPKTGRHAARSSAGPSAKKTKASLLGSMLPGPVHGMPLDQKLDSAHLLRITLRQRGTSGLPLKCPSIKSLICSKICIQCKKQQVVMPRLT